MNWQTILYFTSILLTCVLTGFLTLYAWRQPALPGVRTFGWMVLSECLLALTEMLSMLGGTQEQALFWFNVRVIFIAIIPVLWLKFALEYNGRKDWFSKQLTAGAFIIPLITQVMLWSNSLHGLWVRQEVVFQQNGLFWIAQTSARVPSIWFMVHAFYSMTLLLAGIGVLLFTAWQKREDYRGQAALLSAGALISLVTTVISIFNLLPQSEFNPFVPGVGISVMMYALAIFRFQFLKHTPAQENTSRLTVLKPHEKSSVAILIFIFILLASSIAAASYFTYKNYERQFRAQVENQLSAISALKVDDLQDWRNERLADARLFYQNENFSERVRKYLEDPQDAEARAKLLTWMKKVQASPEYDRIFLLDARSIEQLSIPAAPEAVPPNLVEQAAVSLDSDQIIFLDFHRHSDSDTVHLSMLVPIFNAQNNQPLGVLVLRINPNVYLYPFIQRWPVPSPSAETLLIRRDGSNVLYLNELKFKPDAALSLRVSLENENVPAVKAALGFEGIVTGVDYHNAQVIADIRAVPNSPWFLVSKMDTAEVDAPLRARLWQTIFFFGMLILITGAGLLLIWRQQRIHLYRGQVEAAMALYASEEKFRLAFDTSPDSVAITRVSDGMFVSVNKGFEQITGYTREQVLGKTSAEINIWKDLADRRNVIEELQATGKVQNYEASFVTLDGEIYGLMSAVIIELNGEPHILNITRDITERKRAEEALRESERRFRDIMENVNLISAMLDINGNIIFANNYFLKLTGWQLEEVLGRNWFELLIPPEAEARHVLLEGMKEGPVPPHYQNEIFTRNGELRLIDWSNTLLRDAQGNRAGIAGIGVDITERKRAEKALYESEERFRRLAENAQDLIYRYELSPKRGFSYVSPAATTITGYSPEEHYADPDLGFKLVHPDDKQLLAMATQDGGAIRKPLMLRWIRKDGSMLWTEQRNVPIYAEDGTLVAIEGIAIDITERKRAEAILHESETNLSALIENTDGSIWAVDQQYRLIVGNGEFHHNTSAALGRRLEMGESVLLPSFPAEVNAEWQGLYDRALQGERFTLETVTHFREEPRYIEYRLSPIREDGGEIRGVTVYGRDITERRKAEKEIRFKDDLLHMTSEMAKIGGWEFDALTLEGTWTDEVAHIHGLDPAQPTNVQLGASFYLPDSRRKIEQSIQEAIEFARPYDLELQMVTTNGEQKWVRTMGLPILADGKVVKLQGIFQDITERKLAEEVLHQLNDRLALAQRLAGAGIWDWDLTTGKLNWTPEFFSLFGLDPAKSDATFDTWRGALHPDDIQGAEQRINEAIRDHTPLFNEYRVVTPSDEIRWIGAWGDTTYNERGEAQRMTGLCIDITERKQADEKLRESNSDLKQSQSVAHLGNWKWNLKTSSVEWSDEMFNIFGVDKDSYSGRLGDVITKIIHPDDLHIVLPENASEFATNRPLEYRIIRPNDGELRHIWAQAGESILDEQGNPAFLTGIAQDITERKQAQEKLIVSETRYRRLFEAARDGILIMEAETGIIVDANPFLIEMMGFPLEEFVGKELWELGFFKDIAANKDNFLELQQKEYIRYEDLPLETANGQKFHVEFVSNVYQVNHHKVIQCNIRDITERKQAEENLAASEIRYRRLFEAARDGILILDGETGVVMEVNPFLVEMLGFPQEEICGKELWELGFLKDIAANKENFLELQQEKFIHYEGLPMKTADGRSISVEFVSHAYQVDQRKVIQCNIRNITQRKRAEDAMRDSEEKFRQAFNTSPIAISIARLKGGGFVSINKSFEQMSGYSEPEVIGKTAEELHLWKSPEIHQGLLKELRDNGEVRDYETPILTRNGEIYCLTSASIIEINGEPHILTLAVDITQRKQAEDALRESESLLNKIFDILPVGLWLADKNGNLTRSNEKGREIWGAEPLVGQEQYGVFKARRLPSGEELAPDDWALAHTIREGVTITDELLEIETFGGEKKIILNYTAPVLNQTGSVDGAVIINLDISERMRAENELRVALIKYKTLFDCFPLGITVSDEAGNILETNSAAGKLLSVSEEEQTRRGIGGAEWKIVRSDRTPMPPEEFPSVMANKEKRVIENVEVGIVKADDAITWLSVNAAPLPVEGYGIVVTYGDITERKQAEEALRESEERFKVLHNASFGGITIHDKGKIIECNQGLSEMMGYSRDELLLMDGYLLIAPDSRELVKNNVAANFEKPYEAFGMRKNGEIFPMLLEARSVPYKGKTVRTVEFRDITERKQMEESLRESETFIKTVLNNLPVGVAVNSVEPTVAFNYMNDNFAKFYRTTKEKLSDPDTFWDAAYEEPDFRETMRKKILDDLASGDPECMVWVDIPITRKGEATTFITARNIPIPNQPLMISTVWDVTERKQAEEKLAASEVRYRRLFEATRDGILILDAETGMIVDVNPFLTELLGFSYDVFIGKNIWEIGFFKDIAANKANFLELQQQEYIRYEDLPLETADGRRISVEFTSNVFLTNHLRVVQCNIRDITERKQAREQLLKTLEELKRSNTELEQFAYIASHDLQEPLRAVAGMVQLLQKRYEGQLDARADEYINLAMDGATRMQTLITDLLTYSRVERRGNPMQPVDANKSLISAVRNLQVSIAEQGAIITNDNLPMLEADATQLSQLFQNLIGNAIKFHSEQAPKIHVGVEDLGDAWRFSVRDNGIGIEPQYFERIFLVFQRLHTRREYSGTGIGLSICKKIVERHGGRIWIESLPGQGTTFYFTIPHRS